jgi:Protein of unknown function (DUF3160)
VMTILGSKRARALLHELEDDAYAHTGKVPSYDEALDALKKEYAGLKAEDWNRNLYWSWLYALQPLLAEYGAGYPTFMTTEAYRTKSLNTALASWAQLRHDTILYAKQSYAKVSCFYPAGYVEPVPAFWGRLQKMSAHGADLLEKTPYPPAHKHLQTMQAGFLRNFAARVETLKGIAEKELAQKELTKEETKFLQELIQLNFGCGGPPEYSGWYPGLFYGPRDDCNKWDALVADVHTDPPSEGDPGCVLHQGVGNVDLLIVAIDNGKDRMVYAGPVMSHYEFEMPRVSRKSDSEWRKDLKSGQAPPRPEWTRSYLVPGANKDVGKYVEPNEGKGR